MIIDWSQAQKSSFSNGGANCVQVVATHGAIAIRESDRPDEVILTTPEKLAAFIQGVKAGEFDHFTA